MANEMTDLNAPAEAPTGASVPLEPVAAPVAERTYEELAREIVELEKQFPPPDLGEIAADARWFEAHWHDLVQNHSGVHVAVLHGGVAGHGSNPLQLQLDIARKFNVHPQRFLVEYIPKPGFE